MREILFRAKRRANGVFVEGFLFSKYEGDEIRTCIGIDHIRDYPDGELAQGCYFEVRPETVGQFTGLTDRNGKRIFEGDIVEAALAEGTHKGFSWGCQVVVFDRGAFCLKDRRNEITPLCNYAANVQFEVLGNIHDNPELLEVTE